MLRIHSRDETRLARRRTAVSLAHLTFAAALLHVAPQTTGVAALGRWQAAFATGVVACCGAYWRLASGTPPARLRRALLPMACLPARDEAGEHAYVPGLGWRPVGEELRAEIERRSSLPMVGLALLVLPLLAAEYFWADEVAASARLSWGLAAASAVVWAAFALEFVAGCSLAEKRLDYVKRHWLDLAIVLLPLVAFLRAARLARLASIQKSARVYRLRGLAMKLWRAMVLFDVLGRLLLRTPERRAAKLEERRAELLAEVAAIDARIGELRSAA